MDILKEMFSKVPNKTIYHYTSQSGLLGIITTKTIWATNIHYLNDASEFQVAVQLARGKIPDLIKATREEDAEFLRELDRRLSVIMGFNLRSIYVCSFSSNGNLLSQWRSYCPDGNGFSIGFDYSQLHARLQRQGFRIARCVYDPQAQSEMIQQFLVSALDTFHKTRNAFGEVGRQDWAAQYFAALDVDLEFLRLAPILKDKSFEEEDEWRLISSPILLTHPQVCFREGKSMILPFFKIELAQEDEHLSFPEIFIGPTPHEVLSKISVESLLSAKDFDGSSVRLSGIPYRGW
jgi:Protein of unknown function (DUF2971)